MSSGHSLDGLMKWIRREEWRDAFAYLVDRHLVPACASAHVDVQELPDLIGDHWFMSLWGCAFEDFLTRDLDDGRNIVDDYLKRRGWKESPSTRAYMAALRSSAMSLYEVSDLVLDEGFLVRDLVRGGDPVRVSEKSATKSLHQWDRIATRLLQVGGKNVISGALLSFDRDASEEALASIKRVGKRARKETAKLVKSLGRDADDASVNGLFSEDMVLAGSAFMFSNVWLRDVLKKVRNPVLPQVTNSDGEPLEFQTLHYPLERGATAKAVRSALATVPDFRQENDDFWNWLEAKGSKTRPAGTTAKAQSFITQTDDGTIVLGNIELRRTMLTLSVNSPSRAQRGRALLDRVLKELVRDPLIETQTLEQIMVSRPAGKAKSSSGLSAEDERAVIHQSLNGHYSQMLDEPIPALGNVTPMSAVKTTKGREKVIAWLNLLENHSAQQPAGDPMANYDFTWMWQKLGLADRRR
jgi:hypothetical protein